MPPKYSLPEIERRWLVDLSQIDLAALEEPEIIEDRYLMGTRLRLRRMSGPKGVVYKLVKKYGRSGWVEPITNLYLDEVEYANLATLPARSLVKKRFRLKDGALDLINDAIFEVEFASLEAAQAFQPQTFVLRELEENELTGVELATEV